jgi:TolB-like protein
MLIARVGVVLVLLTGTARPAEPSPAVKPSAAKPAAQRTPPKAEPAAKPVPAAEAKPDAKGAPAAEAKPDAKGAPAAGAHAPELPHVAKSIFAKLEYDHGYFKLIQRLQAEGRRHPALDDEGFAKEVARARVYVPVLDKVMAARPAYEAGEPLPLPEATEAFRVYRNLVAILNIEQAAAKGHSEQVLALGSQAAIRTTRDLGLVRADDDRYYLQLYRHFFFRMAQACFLLGRDSESVAWLARLDAETEVKALRAKVTAAKPADLERADRIAVLRTKPVAVVPLEALDAKDPDAGWLGNGLSESISNDLVQNTELLVVERTQVSKVLGEAWMAKSGLTDPKAAAKLGEMLSAGSLVVGSWRRDGGSFRVSLRLTDASDGRIVASVEKAGAGEAFAAAREALLELLGSIGFVSDAGAAAVRGARLPTTDGLRDLLQARLALGRDPSKARELYSAAARKDPAMARAFADLRSQFSNVTQVVAVTPFANISGSKDDLWMVQGATEALTSDLPRFGFTVTERAQLSALLKQVQVGELVGADVARAAARKLDADFVVVGSVLHQAPKVRVEARFVEVRTAVVVNAAAAEGPDRDLPDVLARLSAEIARRFNEKLSERSMSELMGHKMSQDAFERYAKQELANESARRKAAIAVDQALEKSQARKTEKGPPAFWPGAVGLGAGAVLAGVAFAEASQHKSNASYASALLSMGGSPAELQRITGVRDSEQQKGTTWTAVGVGGVAFAAGSAGYLLWRELRYPGAVPPQQPVTATVVPVPGGAAALVTFQR